MRWVTPARRATAIGTAVALACLAGQAVASVVPAADDPAANLEAQGVHYSGKPLLNPLADLSAPPSDAPSDDAGAADDASIARVGDAHRFDTWSGYDAKDQPVGVATGDFDDDGDVDVAYARNFSGANSMIVQLNQGDGTMGVAKPYPRSPCPPTSRPVTSTATSTSTWSWSAPGRRSGTA